MSTVQAKKRFGQHFLKDPRTAERIVDALTLHGGCRRVLEVGPGTGALTEHLLRRTDLDPVFVEVDREAAQHLRQRFPGLNGRLIEGDILRLDLRTLGDGPLAVIGNFPYNISTQILFHVLAHRDLVREVVGMFQKEVADRVRAAPGSKIYGITSVLCQAWYHVEQVMTLPPGAFDPPPKVNSAVIRMRRNDTERLACDEDLFFRVVKTAFNQRRKTLRNALKGFPGLDEVPTPFADKRAEQLSVNDFVDLTRQAGR